MGDHSAIERGDGWVRCRCNRVFNDNSDLEADARYRRHWREENVHKPGLKQAREALRGEGE